VPGNFQQIQTALHGDSQNPPLSSGDVVEVSPKSGNNAYAYFDMIPGVTVKVVAGTPRVWSKNAAGTDTAYAVNFPSTSQTSTQVIGPLIIEATSGMTGKNIVQMDGGGLIKNCTIDAKGCTVTDLVGLYHTGQSTTFSQDITILMNGTTQPRYGMKLANSSFACQRGRIDIHGGSANYGIYCPRGYTLTVGPKIEHFLVKVPGGTGIELHIQPTGAVFSSIANCTVDSTTGYGIKVDSGTNVFNCIATNALGAQKEIFGREGRVKDCIASPTGFDGPPDTLNHLLGGDAADVGTGSTYGNSVYDPLYCDAAHGVYTLKVDSYGNPKIALNRSGDPGTLLALGKFKVACMFGTLVRSAEYEGNGSLYVPGDVTIPSSKTLTLDSRSTVKMRSPDSLGIGNDSQKVELKVSSGGTLHAAGLGGAKVVFTSTKASQAEGDWWGIEVGSGATGYIEYSDVQYSDYGIRYLSTTAGHISHSTFANNTVWDIVSGVGSGSMNLTVDYDTIAVAGGRGIEFQSAVNGLNIANNRIIGDAPPTYSTAGINFAQFTTGVTPTIVDNYIESIAAGDGIFTNSGAPTIKRNEVKFCGNGIRTAGGTALIGDELDSSSDNNIHQNWIGIRVGGGTPIVRNNQINDSNSTGVLITSSGNPDLGKADPHHGKNTITGSYSHCIDNQNTGVTVDALGNYFGGSCSSPTCTQGNVNTGEYLCSPPAGVDLELAALPARVALRGLFPSPMHSASAIVFDLPHSSNEVQVKVYDLSGRLVRDFGDFPGVSGRNQISWDGLSDQGVRVRNGIYFIHLAVDGRHEGAVKALVVR